MDALIRQIVLWFMRDRIKAETVALLVALDAAVKNGDDLALGFPEIIAAVNEGVTEWEAS